MIVVIDGSRILGLGDVGVQGIGITIGKLDLYVAAAEINLQRVLPVMINVGTNNEELIKDPPPAYPVHEALAIVESRKGQMYAALPLLRREAVSRFEPITTK
ncbi:hypothetical protein NE237_000006 [Protea cynaroides]|uniref:Malic enzyme N-terminal domain-containing protein n=1 Tax=Protea cynaroides TaxID=273540 RepID=A0A9Q0GM69_9MAGN|nr:hypothetical protein NE237_000006 [Protea cynaroides]